LDWTLWIFHTPIPCGISMETSLMVLEWGLSAL